jgi:hypothetical protein
MIERAVAWLTLEKHSTYGLAVTRMILGFIVASQLVVNWPDRHYTWGDGAAWTDAVRSGKSWPGFLGAFQQLDGIGFDALYLVTIVFGTLMMVGFYTRLTTAMSLLLWMSLYVANPFVGSGGDAVLRMVMLYLVFTSAGRRWSVDAWLEGRRGTPRPLVTVPDWWSTTLHNLGMILIVHQVVMVYVGSALWKVQGALWKNGTAVYYPLQTDAYSPWHDLLRPAYALGPVIHGATFLAIVVQLFFPVLLIYRPTRLIGLVLITGMHLGIGIFMGIMYFSLVMIAVDMILVSDASWRAGADWVARQRERRRVSNVEV